MNSLVEELRKFSVKLTSPDTPLEKKHNTLIAIRELDISIEDVGKSNLGKAVKKCIKLEGKTGELAQKLVKKWIKMIHILQDAPKKNNKQISNNNTSDSSEEDYKPNYKKSEIKRESPAYLKVEKNVSSQSEMSSDDEKFGSQKESNQHMQYSYENCQSNVKTNCDIPKMVDNDVISKLPKLEKSNNLKSGRLSCNIETAQNKSKSQNLSFADFLKDSAISAKSSDAKKRHSDALRNLNDNNNNYEAERSIDTKRIKLEPKRVLPEIFKSDKISCDDGFNEEPKFYRMDLKNTNKTGQMKMKTEPEEDIDCTSKYTSERKIWVAKSKIEPQVEDEDANVTLINGVPETEIAQYDYQKLMAFEGNERKIMKKTEGFWQKLFIKNHKCYTRRDSETWRDAFLRAQKDMDLKFKRLSEKVSKNYQEKLNAESRAKMLPAHQVGGRKSMQNRRITDMRR